VADGGRGSGEEGCSLKAWRDVRLGDLVERYEWQGATRETGVLTRLRKTGRRPWPDAVVQLPDGTERTWTRWRKIG
jgi:hypothetical protein